MMVCAKVQILRDLQDGSEIKISVADDGDSVMISGTSAKIVFFKEDFCEFIAALMAADAYMDRMDMAKDRPDHMAVKLAH